jgi:hypothetical protein
MITNINLYIDFVIKVNYNFFVMIIIIIIRRRCDVKLNDFEIKAAGIDSGIFTDGIRLEWE